MPLRLRRLPRLQPEIAVRHSKWASRCSPKSRWPPISRPPPRWRGGGSQRLDHDVISILPRSCRAAKPRCCSRRGAIGRLRYLAVTWNVENQTTRMRLTTGRPCGQDGGGALGNFVSHSSIISNGSAGRFPGCPPDCRAGPTRRPSRPMPGLSLAFGVGRARSLPAMSCASYPAPATASNFTAKTARGAGQPDQRITCAVSTFGYARRPARRLSPSMSRRSARRAFPADGGSRRYRASPAVSSTPSTGKKTAWPGFAEGYRVQILLDTARRSHDQRAAGSPPSREIP